MGSLLLRGMLAGLLASFLAFGFAKVFGEPQVERAIALEEQYAKSADPVVAHEGVQAHEHSHAKTDELVSRDVQAGIGLLTGIVAYGTALGGLFALVYAFISGRLVRMQPSATAILLSAVGFLALYIVPYIKYPVNPPAVGLADTIGYRSQLYFAMIIFSLAALAIAINSGRRLLAKLGGWNATFAGGAIYLALVTIAAYALPAINEVPETFPTDLLWQFRVAALGTQAILWATIGLAFGWLIERSSERRTR